MKLYTSPDQKKLHDTLKCASFLKDIFELKLTNSDFEYLDANLKVCNAEAIASFIKEISLKYELPIGSGYDLGNIYSNIPIALDFYRTAEKRNHAILDNTIKRMNEQGQSVAALITGGYHTKGISELLKAKQTSYLVILPKFDASKGERPYVAILTNKADNYEEELQSGKYQLLSETYLKDSIQEPKKIDAFITEIVIVSIGQAVIERKDIASVKKMWIESYKNAYEELVKKGIVRESFEPGTRGSEKGSKVSGSSNVRFGDKNIAGTTSMPPVNSLAAEKFAKMIDDIQAVRISNAVAVVQLGDIYRAVELKSDGTLENRECKKDERTFAARGIPAGETLPGALTPTQRIETLEKYTRDLLIDSIVDSMAQTSQKGVFDEAEFNRVALRKITYQRLSDPDRDALKAEVMKRLSVQKQEFIKKIAKGVESPVKFEELLPAQQKTFEKGLADYRENLAGMDPEGAASLTAQSINIWRNMKAGVARYRDRRF